MCVWLSFIFAAKQYNYICDKCHNRCLRCIKNIAKYQLNKQNERRVKEVSNAKKSYQQIANDYHPL